MSPNSRATYSSVCINGKWDDSYIVRFIRRDGYFSNGLAQKTKTDLI